MSGMKILIGVTGGIAAYKTCELVRLFVKNGDDVRVVMTENAGKFVTPLTFEVLSRNAVPQGMFGPRAGPPVEHIEAASWCDCFVVAPATANIIGKLAGGIADDLLTTLALAVPLERPAILAPAMNVHMWNHPMVRENIRKLTGTTKARYTLVPPVEKELACGDTGIGGLAAPETIFRAVQDALQR